MAYLSYIPVPGICYVSEAIDEDYERKLLEFLDKQDWSPVSSVGSRRVIHYGYRYHYMEKKVNQPAPEIPKEFDKLLSILKKYRTVPDTYEFNQCIVNEYLPGQGIAAHIDDLQYGSYIACYSLGSGIDLEFKKGTETWELWTEPRSVYVMSGPARDTWTHQIRPRKFDYVDGVKTPRQRRISITFRHV